MLKINFILTSLAIAFVTLLPSPINAKTATPSASTQTATPSATPTTTDTSPSSNLEQRIKNIVSENLATTEAKIRQKLSDQLLFGFVGKITNIASTGLTFNSSNEILQISLGESTQIVKDGNNIKSSLLAIGDKAIVIGTSQQKFVINAKRIVVVKDTPSNKSTILLGKVTAVDAKKRIIKLQTPSSKETISLLLSRKATLVIDDITVGARLLALTNLQGSDMVISKAKILP